MRLLSFLPGEILFSVPYTKELFFQVGELVAKTDLDLMVCIIVLLQIPKMKTGILLFLFFQIIDL